MRDEEISADALVSPKKKKGGFVGQDVSDCDRMNRTLIQNFSFTH